MKDFENQEIYMSGPDVTNSDAVFVMDSLSHGWYGSNAYKYVELFESGFASFHSRKFALMTPNCTHAIHLLLSGLGIGHGDSVIVPDITWIATAAPIKYVGAEIIFADVDEKNWCLSVDTIKKVIKPNTKAVIAVDVYGNMPNYRELEKYCQEMGIILIEDAAEALGSITNSKRAGKFGKGSVFSFHRTKTLTTGEGGMLLVDDENLYQRCKFLRDHGRKAGSFYCEEIAYKYMPSNLLASLGFAQLKRIDQLVGKKIEILNFYKAQFESWKLFNLNPVAEGDVNGAWCSVLNWSEKLGIKSQKVNALLTQKGIPTRPFFYPLSSLPFVQKENKTIENRNKNIIAEQLHNNSICLPSSLNMTKKNLEKVSCAVKEVFNEIRR